MSADDNFFSQECLDKDGEALSVCHYSDNSVGSLPPPPIDDDIFVAAPSLKINVTPEFNGEIMPSAEMDHDHEIRPQNLETDFVQETRQQPNIWKSLFSEHIESIIPARGNDTAGMEDQYFENSGEATNTDFLMEEIFL